MKQKRFAPQTLMRHLIFLSAFFIFGCSTYQSFVADARDMIQRREFDAAIEALKKRSENTGGDQLAYLLEYATALHQAGRYEESNKVFLQADKMADLNDYTSVSREAGTYVVNEGMTQFKAETFEYMLINVYQALNYIMLADYDNAQVMARRIVAKLAKLEIDKESKKKQASFASYLSALIYEAQGDWDNAYILYNKAYEAVPDNEQYQRDVLVSARRANRTDTYERLKAKWPALDKAITWSQTRGQGEFIFIFQQGWIPRKQMRPENQSLPMMVTVPTESRFAVATVDDKKFESKQVFDLENVATVTLDEDYKRLVAKAIARAASREAVRQAAIHNRNRDASVALGAAAIASIFLQIADRADLRQWSTLPAYFQIVRVSLSEGTHKISVDAQNKSPLTPPVQLWSGDVKISKNKKFFMTQRAY